MISPSIAFLTTCECVIDMLACPFLGEPARLCVTQITYPTTPMETLLTGISLNDPVQDIPENCRENRGLENREDTRTEEERKTKYMKFQCYQDLLSNYCEGHSAQLCNSLRDLSMMWKLAAAAQMYKEELYRKGNCLPRCGNLPRSSSKLRRTDVSEVISVGD